MIGARAPTRHAGGRDREVRHSLAEHFDEPTLAIDVDMRLAPSVVEHDEAERQVVEQFVRDDHAVERFGREVRPRLDAVGMSFPLRRRQFDRDIAQRIEAGGPGGEHRAGERARASTDVDHRERVGPADALPLGIEVAGEHGAEQRSDLR